MKKPLRIYSTLLALVMSFSMTVPCICPHAQASVLDSTIVSKQTPSCHHQEKADQKTSDSSTNDKGCCGGCQLEKAVSESADAFLPAAETARFFKFANVDSPGASFLANSNSLLKSRTINHSRGAPMPENAQNLPLFLVVKHLLL